MTTDTSLAALAWRKARGIDVAQNGAVYEHLLVYGPRTADELDAAFEVGLHADLEPWPVKAATKALNKLKRAGAVVDTGERRPTRTGRNAAVYRAVTPDEDITNNPDLAAAHQELEHRARRDRIDAAIDQTTADRLPRVVRIPNPDPARRDILVTIRVEGLHTQRPPLPA
jgi:hypothetical protein